jgi:hypothetical protein
MNPESFTDNHSANYADHAVIGRAHPRSQWVSSGEREISFTLELDSRNETSRLGSLGVKMRDFGTSISYPTARLIPSYGKDDPGVHGYDIAEPEKRLMVVANFLRALTKPKVFSAEQTFGNEIFSAPPKVLFVWGPYFRVRCIVRSVEIEWLQFSPELVPTRAAVDITLHEQPLAPVTYDDYLKRGDTRNAPDSELGIR